MTKEEDAEVRSDERAAQQEYREYLESVGVELDRRHPGVFQWRFGKPSEGTVDGLIVTKADVGGYVFVVGSSRWSGGTQGGVLRRGAEHSYSGCIMRHREWEHADMSHGQAEFLEGHSSTEPAGIVDWLARDWAFERPWRAPRPVDPKAERKRLEKIATGLQSRSGLAVVVDATATPEHQLTPAGSTALASDLEGLVLDRIRDGFPPDKNGLLALKTTVLLNRYPTTSPPARDRELCLVAVGPQRRSDTQEIRVTLDALIPLNQDHCWERERWRWHADSAGADPATRWGAPVPVAQLAAGELAVSRLQESLKRESADAGERAALAILLQDEGRLLEALELYGVDMDDDVRRLCGGQKIYPPACCAYADEKWVQRLCDWMRLCAPWLLASATRREAERIAAWAAEKKSRRRRLPALKLLIFPGQHHSRKASLMLTSTDIEGTSPRLEIQATGGNTRLHESAWKRPLEIDLARHQIPGVTPSV